MREGTPSELLDLTGTVVAVTGAAAGIGAGVARRLSEAGASVLVHTRTSDPSTVLESLVGPAASVAADLTEPDGPAKVLAAALDAFGQLDAVVNNAGLQTVATLREMSASDWQSMLDTNLTAIDRMTTCLADHLIERRAGGSVVHIASIEGSQPAFAHGHYATTKAAVKMHAKAAALEFGRVDIRVNSVSPGLIDREGLAQAWPEGVDRWLDAAPLGRLGAPRDVGDACVFLISDLAQWITGIDLVVDGGVLARPTW